MNLSYNFVSFIDALGVIQGLLFGIMLIHLQSKKNKPTLFLGVFIILFSLEPITNILQDSGILSQYPQWELFPVGFHFLELPLFYIYIQKISIYGNEKTSYWTLIPGGLEFIAALIVFFLPIETKLEIKTSSFAFIYFFSGLCYSIYISVLILRWIYFHSKELENQYTSVHNKTLNWSKLFIYSSIVFHLLLLIDFFLNSYYLYATVTVFNIILIYWVSFKGIVQENIVAVVWVGSPRSDVHIPITETPVELEKPESLNITSKSQNDLMTQEETIEIYKTVDDYIINSKCYINDKLTIIDVAEAVNIHPKRISHAINSIKTINFNNYINAFRVEYAKALLKSDATKNLSIEGIGIEAGFHSKTTFYSAFRKQEDMTPAQFKSS